ncbi:hypothetical protein [Actinocrispum wychmicini]|nr:hypothetical protein [Actinocrispum wychmicini]
MTALGILVIGALGGLVTGSKPSSDEPLGAAVVVWLIIASVLALAVLVFGKRDEHAFPEGLDTDTCVAVRLAVLRGGPVDPVLAPAVAHHTRVVLSIPFRPGYMYGILGLPLAANLIRLGVSIDDHEPRAIAWHAVVAIVIIGVLLCVPRAKRKRVRVRAAEQEALRLMGQEVV